MAKRKVTFTLDAATVTRLRRAAERLSKPQSEVVREAIRDYSERVGRLSEAERLALLERFDELVARIPARPLREVEEEIETIRAARRAGGRRPAKTRRR
jgi:predicted transcriptional regulator